VRKCKACAGGFHRECRLHSFLSSLLAVAYSQRSRLLLSSTTFLHSCRVHKEEVLERFLSLSLSLFLELYMCRMYLALVGIWDTLIGIPLSIFVAYRELKTSGPHPVWRQTARQHLLHFITTHIYIYIYIWLPLDNKFFFCQLSKDLQLEWTFECVLAPTLSVQWDSQAPLLAGQEVSLHTHTHTHIYTQATMITIEVYYILLVWSFRICFFPAVFFWQLEKLKFKKTNQPRAS